VTRLIHFTLLVVLAATYMACDRQGSDSPPQQTAQLPPERVTEKPEYIPPANMRFELSPSVRESLRVYRDRHNITRDEYWDGHGGVLANEFFEVWYPEGKTGVTHGLHCFNIIMPARQQFANAFGSAPEGPLVIYCIADMVEYRGRTTRDWWHYSEIKGDTLTYQPLFVLVKRGLDAIAVPREYFKWAIRRSSGERAPRWLEDGMASRMAGEGDLLRSQLVEFDDYYQVMSADDVETLLEEEEDRARTRIAYYRAYRMATNLVDRYGEDQVWTFVSGLGEGMSPDDASRKVFGQPFDKVVAMIEEYEMPQEL